MKKSKIFKSKTILRIDNKIRLLGSNKRMNTLTFLNIRFILIIFIFIILLMFTKKGFILAPLSAFIIYYLMEYLILDYPAKKRGKKLENEALFFFEVFILTLEGGRNLRQALTLTTENVDSELSEEFKQTLKEAKMGKSLNEALEAMKKRIPSETINNTILNMIESHMFGNDIRDTLDNQIAYLRSKQVLDIKAKIATLPTKVSIISVIFFIPIMLLIILAPLIIEYISK